MNNRLYSLLLSALLLAMVGYVQVFQDFFDDSSYSVALISDTNDDAEEGAQKTSEENASELDQDEDPIKLVEILILSSLNSGVNSKIECYSLGHFGYYPEIVSPPPQA